MGTQPNERVIVKKLITPIVIAMILTGVIAIILTGTSPAAEVEGFYQDFAKAKSEAKKLNKPMYLHFTTTWCGWCRKIENDIYKKKEGKEALKGFVPASLDCTVPEGKRPSGQKKINLDLMAKYGGSGYPFLVMVTVDGVLLNSFAGYKPMAPFKEELKKATANMEAYKTFKAYAAKADKKSYEYNEKALVFYSKVGAWDKAVKAGTVIEKEVREKDPKNQKGLLEKVLWAKAFNYYQQGTRAKSKTAAFDKLRKTVEILKELTSKAQKLSNGSEVYSLLGFSQATLGQFDDAIVTYEKLLTIVPKGAPAQGVKQMINSLKAEAAKVKKK